MTLGISELAAHELEDIYDYIARDNPEAALEILQELYELMERLLTFPHLGHSGTFGACELVKAPFVVVYRIVADAISVEAVFHGSRRYLRSNP